MAKRRRYNRRSPIWSWISFLIFGLIIIWLGYSAITRTTPGTVLSSLWSDGEEVDEIYTLSKDELITRLQASQSEVATLQRELEECKVGDGFTKGIIDTTSPTLNLRSEPSLESEILMKIPSQSTVSILYYDERRLILDGATGQWCRIKYADQEGWAWGNYVREINQ